MTLSRMFRLLFATAILHLASSQISLAASEKIAAELRLQADANRLSERVPVIITFSDKADLASLAKISNKQERRFQILTRLKAQASDPARLALRELLHQRGILKVQDLWINNSIATTIPAGLISEIASWPSVSSIRPDAVVQAPDTTYSGTTPTDWNLQAVHAPESWSLGFTGQGVVVGIFDTGVDVSHPDLVAQYRGGSNSWFDPFAQHAAPYDARGHGTQVAGVMVGRQASGAAIGMAPNARWIAARAFDDSQLSTYSALHQSFQWLLDPDSNPATDDAPDVVNASWGLENVPGGCSYEFQPDIQALKTAGIAIVFSAGNGGPGPSTSLSPANNPEGFSVGAVDDTLTIASFSARGPSACDGGIDPDLVAPGVAVATTDTSFGLGTGSYVSVNGTSFAAPHVSGAIALLLSANPGLTVSELEASLQQSAVDLGTTGVDNDYGHGLLNAYAAVQSTQSDAPTAQNDSATTNEDTAVIIDVLANDSDTKGRSLQVKSVDSTSPHGTVVLNADQTVTYTPAPNYYGSDSFNYVLSNGVGVSLGTVSVTVVAVNDAPLAVNDLYVVDANASGQFQIPAPGVLQNDSDVDGDTLTAVLVSNVATGSVTLQSNGAFVYTPPAGAGSIGPLTFTYQVSDGQAVSTIATVSFTINRPPVAVNDNLALPPPDAQNVYRWPNPGVLANDSDPDGNSLSASLVTNTQSGTVVLDPQGGFKYIPPASGLTGGNLSFTYQVSDGRLSSNVATVSFVANHAPVAANDSVVLSAANANSPYVLPAPGVLANDHDPDKDPMTASLESFSQGGQLSLAANGSVSYTPPATGSSKKTLSFSYRVSDGKTTSNLATVTATLNRAPVAAGDTGIVLEQNSQGIYEYTGNLLANDSDPDGDLLTAQMQVNVTTGGVVTLTDNGGFIFTPPAGSLDPDKSINFSYQASDAKTLSEPVIVSFTIKPPVVSTGGYYPGSGYTPPYSPPVSSGTGAINNPAAPASDPFGSSSGFNQSSASASNSAANAAQTDAARRDSAAQEQSKASNKDQADTEHALHAEDDLFAFSEPDKHGVYAESAPGVLVNDSGEGKLSAILVRNVRYGKVRLNADGSFAYQPPRGGAPSEPQSFSYRIRDSKGYSKEATVTLQIESGLEARPDVFVLQQRDASGNYRIDAPGVIANDRHHKPARAMLVQNVLVGEVKLGANGSFIYQPPSVGGLPRTPLTFSYRLNTGSEYSRIASVTFTLAQELSAEPDTLVLSAVDAQGRYVLPPPGVLANDSGTGKLRAVLLQGASSGHLILNPDGGLTYDAPPQGQPAQPVSFQYQVDDGKKLSKPASVSFTLRPVKSKPASLGRTPPACAAGEPRPACLQAAAKTAGLGSSQ